jgi:hypothetical protein
MWQLLYRADEDEVSVQATSARRPISLTVKLDDAAGEGDDDDEVVLSVRANQHLFSQRQTTEV